jgi:ParB family transcriptional regulator, chromosome partitioning protein
MSDKKALGRGLSALLSDVDLDFGTSATPDDHEPQPIRPDATIPVGMLHANPNQPRRRFEEGEISDLAQSIREHGILQPLIVRPHPGLAGQYQIVAGERRWRGAQLAQLHQVPVVIREMSDTEALQVAIVENIQRADLNPIEEAQGYRSLMDNFGHTQERLAEALGKSRPHIANQLRLLTLPERVLNMVREGSLSAGHARACLAAPNPAALADEIISRGLSVREAEQRARKPEAPTPEPRTRAGAPKDPDTVALENDLAAHLGLKVSIENAPGGQNGEIRIRYRNLDELDGVIQLLSQ